MKLLVANPGYGQPGAVSLVAQLALWRAHPEWTIYHFELSTSLLATTFNFCWCHALNLREKEGLTHFLMIHSDVRPIDNDDWFDTLLGEMEKNQGEVISAIIPIKDERGLTSTAIDTHPWRPVRISMKQAIEQLPESWTTPGLLFNTGLMLVDMRRDWVEKICFTVRDKIEKDPKTGLWQAYAQPEDWDFSRQCRALGVRCIVTRAVKVQHFGNKRFNNYEPWGDEKDTDNLSFAIQTAGPQLPQGWFSSEDIRTYREMYEELPDHAIVAEAGVFLGRSLCSVADIIKRKNIFVNALDTFGSDPITGRGTPGTHRAEFENSLETAGIRERVCIVEGSFVETMTRLPDKLLDLVFIDGSHDYESVKCDLETFHGKLKPGGILAGHDWNYPGVEKAVRERFPDVSVAHDSIWSVRMPEAVEKAA